MTKMPFELSVYRSKTGDEIVGCGRGAAFASDDVVTANLIIRFGTPIEEAYDLARSFCAEHGIGMQLRDRHGRCLPWLDR